MKQRLLVADGITLGTFTRKAKGYKKIIADPSLDRQLVKFVDEEVNGERILRLVKDEGMADNNFDDEEYIIVTKEFGLMGYDKGVKANIDYIFCDDGVMFITLKAGALIIHLEDRLLMPNVNYESKVSFALEDVLWVDSNRLKSYHKTIGDSGDYATFINEFKFNATVAGQVAGKSATSSGLSSFSFKPDIESFEDLSLGAYDVYKAKKKVRDEAKAAKNIMKQVSNTTTEYDFDDDEEDALNEDYEDDDDYSDFDV